ncbi:hypothetical protein ABZ511_00535 [Nocardia gamkensis]|uniref:hypothetical protein n=1 Tax=Nocardia gamkensis TaxID=352869 RepID=UPI0033F3C2D9
MNALPLPSGPAAQHRRRLGHPDGISHYLVTGDDKAAFLAQLRHAAGIGASDRQARAGR